MTEIEISKALALAVIGAKSNDLTKDEILAMAREASIVIPTRFSHDRTIDELERFATLCRAPLVAEIETLRYELDAVAEIKQERETCTWTEQDDKDMPGTYESSCGEMWSFIEGGLKENRVTYCHYCGGKVVPASPQEQT